MEGEKIMDYKKLVMELLEKLDEKKVKYIYFFIQGMLGAK